jgi:hypothetical protein
VTQPHATRYSDGRPLTLADLSEFVADLAAAGVPTTDPVFVETVSSDGPGPAVAVTALVTREQAEALPDRIEVVDAEVDPSWTEV